MASVEEIQVPLAKAEPKHAPLPQGKYTIIAIDVDTTGKRLIDEIVQVALYNPDGSYSQYIMPLMNLNPAARQRHQVRVITVGFFRMLKSMQTYKVMKTKTEIAALNEFLDHLSKAKTNDAGSQGVILVFHEQRKFVPYMIIEAMKKYNLLTQFMEIVKSFVNTYPIAVEKCGNPMKYFNLHRTAKVLINPNNELKNDKVAESEEKPTEEGAEKEPTTVEPKPITKTSPVSDEPFEGNASVRAKLSFDIGQQLACAALDEENKDEKLSPNQLSDKFMQLALSYANSIDVEIEELKEQERILERQSSLRPIFLSYFRTTLHHRVKAVTYRRVLAELGFNMESLEALWTESKKDGLMTAISKSDELKPEDRNELVEILDHHYDPDKQAVKPHVNHRRSSSSRRRRRPVSRSTNNNNNNMNGKPVATGDGNATAANDPNNNVNKNKENVPKGFTSAENAASKGARSKRSPRRSFRRNRINRGLAAAN